MSCTQQMSSRQPPLQPTSYQILSLAVAPLSTTQKSTKNRSRRDGAVRSPSVRADRTADRPASHALWMSPLNTIIGRSHRRASRDTTRAKPHRLNRRCANRRCNEPQGANYKDVRVHGHRLVSWNDRALDYDVAISIISRNYVKKKIILTTKIKNHKMSQCRQYETLVKFWIKSLAPSSTCGNSQNGVPRTDYAIDRRSLQPYRWLAEPIPNPAVHTSVPAMAKGQGAKEIGHNLARERHKIFYARTTKIWSCGQLMKTWAQICKHFTSILQAFLHRLSENTKTANTFCKNKK